MSIVEWIELAQIGENIARYSGAFGTAASLRDVTPALRTLAVLERDVKRLRFLLGDVGSASYVSDAQSAEGMRP